MKAKLKEKIKFEPTWDERKGKIYRIGIMRKVSNRKEQVLLVRLRSGHCSNARYYGKRIGKETDDRCNECGEEEEKV